MESVRWKQVDNLLQLALECPQEDRDAFVRSGCAGDEALERELRSLLAFEQEAASFLEGPVMDVAALDLVRRQKPDTHGSAHFPAGKTVSHYRIVGKLG